ncbi:hypothetical protein LRC484719_42910 [Mycobacterium riyadhense]
MAAITGGGTVAANAASYAAADAMACTPACSAAAPVYVNQAMYGWAAAAAESDAGPSHSWPVSSDITASKEVAVELSSTAKPFHAAAADSSGPAPAPEYISAELTSGGNAAKSMVPIP